MSAITIREDFRDLIPPLSEGELDQLLHSIELNGCLTPLMIEPPATRFDEIDQAMADPIVDRVPQARAKWKTRGVLNVLNQLDRNSNRRCQP